MGTAGLRSSRRRPVARTGGGCACEIRHLPRIRSGRGRGGSPTNASGRGTSRSSKRAFTSSTRARKVSRLSKRARLVAGVRADPAGARPAGEIIVGVGVADLRPGGLRRGPVCGCDFQWMHSAPHGLAAISCPLRLSRLVKKPKPSGPWRRISTIRTEGRPSGVAVASAMASGSLISPASARAIHSANRAKGSVAGHLRPCLYPLATALAGTPSFP